MERPLRGMLICGYCGKALRLVGKSGTGYGCKRKAIPHRERPFVMSESRWLEFLAVFFVRQDLPAEELSPVRGARDPRRFWLGDNAGAWENLNHVERRRLLQRCVGEVRVYHEHIEVPVRGRDTPWVFPLMLEAQRGVRPATCLYPSVKSAHEPDVFDRYEANRVLTTADASGRVSWTQWLLVRLREERRLASRKHSLPRKGSAARKKLEKAWQPLGGLQGEFLKRLLAMPTDRLGWLKQVSRSFHPASK